MMIWRWLLSCLQNPVLRYERRYPRLGLFFFWLFGLPKGRRRQYVQQAVHCTKEKSSFITVIDLTQLKEPTAELLEHMLQCVSVAKMQQFTQVECYLLYKQQPIHQVQQSLYLLHLAPITFNVHFTADSPLAKQQLHSAIDRFPTHFSELPIKVQSAFTSQTSLFFQPYLGFNVLPPYLTFGFHHNTQFVVFDWDITTVNHELCLAAIHALLAQHADLYIILMNDVLINYLQQPRVIYTTEYGLHLGQQATLILDASFFVGINTQFIRLAQYSNTPYILFSESPITLTPFSLSTQHCYSHIPQQKQFISLLLKGFG